MIEFKGEISKYGKKLIFCKQIRTFLMVGVFFVLLVSTPIILLGVYVDLIYLFWLIVPILCGICFPFIPVYDLDAPLQIEIEDGVVYITSKTHIRSIDVADVKKVIDYGECYYIFFYFPHKSMNCLCQKDLIVQGTIEEFEELFKLYIVRKDGK